MFCLTGTLLAYESDEDILEHAEKILKIREIERIHHPEEKILHTCREGKSELQTIRQERIVPVAPPIFRDVKKCDGHEEKAQKDWGHEHQMKKWWRDHIESNRNPFLERPNYEGTKCWKDWRNNTVCKLKAWYRHSDDQPLNKCDHFHWEKVVDKPAEINGPDEFVYDAPETLAKLQSDPRCHLVSSAVVDGASTRNIHGLAVFRDYWSKNLVYSCNDSTYSDCTPLIEQGSIFVRKRCVKSNLMGGCDEWEKTYDVGKKKAWIEEIYHFEEGKEIPGLTGEFDRSLDHEKKASDLPKVLSVMSLFSNLAQKDVEKTDSGELTNLYPGAPFSCRCRSFDLDCCQSSAKEDQIEEQMKECTQEEKELAALREQQRCIYLGTKNDLTNQTTEHLYCCFASKISRIVQEQVREKGALAWMQDGEPQCRGLTPEEITSAGGLSNLNLTEAEEDFAPAEQQINEIFQKTILQQLNNALMGNNCVK